MPKFTFICEDDPMPFSESIVTKRTVEFDAVLLNDVVSEFELFLRGAGFNPPGILDFVQDEPIEPDSSCHSEHYFDTERNK
jgi:hypothetical protein